MSPNAGSETRYRLPLNGTSGTRVSAARGGVHAGLYRGVFGRDNAGGDDLRRVAEGAFERARDVPQRQNSVGAASRGEKAVALHEPVDGHERNVIARRSSPAFEPHVVKIAA